jgi:hypothetical protein
MGTAWYMWISLKAASLHLAEACQPYHASRENFRLFSNVTKNLLAKFRDIAPGCSRYGKSTAKLASEMSAKGIWHLQKHLLFLELSPSFSNYGLFLTPCTAFAVLAQYVLSPQLQITPGSHPRLTFLIIFVLLSTQLQVTSVSHPHLMLLIIFILLSPQLKLMSVSHPHLTFLIIFILFCRKSSTLHQN